MTTVFSFSGHIENAFAPQRAYSDDVGFDLYSPNHVSIFSRSMVKIDTGICVNPSEGYYAQIQTLSRLAERGLIVVGGVIDPSYRGSIHVVLWNISNDDQFIVGGDAIAQAVLLKYVVDAKMEYPDSIVDITPSHDYPRSKGAFGSSEKGVVSA